MGALLPNVLGYCDPDVDRAISRQLERGISFSLPTVLEFELAERIVRHVPCAEMVRFGKSGSDATTAAVRLARAYTGRDGIQLTPPGYHGWHDWSIAHAENVDNRKGTPRVVYSGDNVPNPAAIIVDCSKHGSKDVRRYRRDADDMGALLIFDEVITGFRYDLGGAQKLYGVTPDLACFSKAMGNGMPISVICGPAHIMGMFDHVFYSGTFGGETLSLAAACACIDKIERENVCRRLSEMGRYIKYYAMKREDFVWLTGHLSCQQLNFCSPQIRETFLTSMLAQGILLNTAINVCYAHTDDDLDKLLEAWRFASEACEQVAA